MKIVISLQLDQVNFSISKKLQFTSFMASDVFLLIYIIHYNKM